MDFSVLSKHQLADIARGVTVPCRCSWLFCLDSLFMVLCHIHEWFFMNLLFYSLFRPFIYFIIFLDFCIAASACVWAKNRYTKNTICSAFQNSREIRSDWASSDVFKILGWNCSPVSRSRVGSTFTYYRFGLEKIQLYFKFDHVEPSFLHGSHAEGWNFRHKPIFLGVKLIAIHIFFWLDPETYVFSKHIPHLIIVSVDTQLDAFLSWLMSFSRFSYTFCRLIICLNSWKMFWCHISLGAIILLFIFFISTTGL